MTLTFRDKAIRMASSQSDNGRTWILAGTMLIIALGFAALIAWLLVGPATGAQKTPAAAETPHFFKLDPFTVNLQSGLCGNRLLYVGITLELGGEHNEALLREYLPQVRSRLLLVLSGQDAAALITSDGKRKLAEAIGTALQQPFAGNPSALQVDDVLFTQFIVQ